MQLDYVRIAQVRFGRVAKKSAKFPKTNFGRIYIVLRRKKFEIFFGKTLLIGAVYIIPKNFE